MSVGNNKMWKCLNFSRVIVPVVNRPHWQDCLRLEGPCEDRGDFSSLPEVTLGVGAEGKRVGEIVPVSVGVWVEQCVVPQTDLEASPLSTKDSQEIELAG